jgi:hypothetical protein
MPDMPQFVTTDDIKIDNTKMISINLSSGIMPIHKNTNTISEPGEIIIGGYTKTLLNGGYIQLPYICPGGITKTNATYIENSIVKKYQTKNLYIFNKSHVIRDITYDAELVIELEPSTNTGDKLYLCFLLKCYRDAKKPANDIDNIIKKSDNADKKYNGDSCNLQKLITENQKKIVYKRGINTIVIFTNTINIKEADFSKYSTIPSDLFALTPADVDDYKIISLNIQEGLTRQILPRKNVSQSTTDISGKTAIMTCTPINTGEESENDNAVIQINTDTNVTTTSLAIQVGIFTTMFISLVAIFIVPPVYFWFMRNVNIDNDERIIYNIIFSILLVILGMVLYFNGKKNDPTVQPLAGFIVLLFLSLSIAGIRMNYKSLEDIELCLSNFNFNAGLLRISNKWKLNRFYIMIFMLCLFVGLFFINFFGVKKKKFPRLKNKSTKYLNNLSKLIWGFGLFYGFIMGSILVFFNTRIE